MEELISVLTDKKHTNFQDSAEKRKQFIQSNLCHIALNHSHFLKICLDSDNFLQLPTCQFPSYLLKYSQRDQFLSHAAGKASID